MVEKKELDVKDIEELVHDLSKSMERMKARHASRDDVIVKLKQSQHTRLELLARELQSVFEQVPGDNDQFEFALTGGKTPRLWLDMSSYVRMGIDRRQYELVKDTRMGRTILASTDDMNRMGQAVTDYIADKMLERERLIEGEWIAMDGYDFDGDKETDSNAVKIVNKRSGWQAMGGFFLGAIASVGVLFAITIVSNNSIPKIVKDIEDVTFVEDTTIKFSIPGDSFLDADGDQLTFTARLSNGKSLPDWLSFEASTQTFFGTPPANMVGSLLLAVVASDSETSTIEYFSLSITGINDDPVVVIPLIDLSFTEDKAFKFIVPGDTFSDVDGDTLTLSTISEDGSRLPSWLSFDGVAFSGTPPWNYSGMLNVVVVASDGIASVTDDFLLAIEAVNDAPVLANALIDQSFDEDTAVSFALPKNTFEDVDGDIVAIGVALADGRVIPAWLSFDGGTLTGIPPQDFNGILQFVVTATDEEFSVSDSFQLTIEVINDAPVVVNSLVAQTVFVETTVSFTIPADTFSDVDGDTLTLSATLSDGSAIPAWLLFDGFAFTGTPPLNFNGVLELQVTASDGVSEASSSFNLTIACVSRNGCP